MNRSYSKMRHIHEANLSLEKRRFKQLLESHMGNVRPLISEQGKTIPVADFNEGVITGTQPNDSFGPDSMVGKTINLYDDQGKQVWDQKWYIMDHKKSNYNKVLTFNLNKDLDKKGSPITVETGVMTFDCNNPDSFTVSYDYKGADTNISNQPRYNPDVTQKLKQEYCPKVLNVSSPNADFAYQQNAGQKSGADLG